MSVATALILASAATAAPPPAGVQLASAQVRAEILEAVLVRQRSGPEASRGGPTPQITRREGIVLVEFE